MKAIRLFIDGLVLGSLLAIAMEPSSCAAYLTINKGCGATYYANELITIGYRVTGLPGDTVVVKVKIKEGERERLQAYEGVVIAKKNRGINSSFTVRKISHNEGVERVFQTYSPQIESIKRKRRGDVRKAKLYHLRNLSGRRARIREKVERKSEGGKTTSA